MLGIKSKEEKKLEAQLNAEETIEAICQSIDNLTQCRNEMHEALPEIAKVDEQRAKVWAETIACCDNDIRELESAKVDIRYLVLAGRKAYAIQRFYDAGIKMSKWLLPSSIGAAVKQQKEFIKARKEAKRINELFTSALKAVVGDFRTRELSEAGKVYFLDAVRKAKLKEEAKLPAPQEITLSAVKKAKEAALGYKEEMIP